MKHHTPHPRILALASVLFSAFMLVGCSDKAALESVDYVLNNAQQEPTEALERIASIDKGSIRGKHNRARYALAYSEALYYNRISSNSDTLVAPMMQYYIHLNDNHLERARALYQYALIKVNEMEYPEALLAISEALKSLDIEEDYKLRGLLHRTEGEIYFTNMLPNNSLESYISAKEYFDKADLPSHSLYTLCQIGTTAIYMRDYEVGESYLLEAKRLAKSLNDKYTLSDILHSLCIKYIQNEEYDKCKTTLEEYHTYDCLLGFHSDYHCFCAIIAFYNRDYQSSQEHIAIAESLVTPDDTLLEHTKYMLALSSEDYERAYDIYSNMVEKQDGAILNAISHPILNKQIDYLAKSLDDEQCKNSLVRQRNTILFITLFLIVILCIVYIYRKKIEYRNTTTSYIDIIDELRRENSQIEYSNLKISAYSIYEDYLNELNKLCELFYIHGDTSREAIKVTESVRIIVDKIRSDEEKLQKLEQIANINHNNVITRLRSENVLNEKELKYVLYTIVGFSARATSMLMGIDTAAISRIKYKIKGKISALNCEYDQEIFGR